MEQKPLTQQGSNTQGFCVPAVPLVTVATSSPSLAPSSVPSGSTVVSAMITVNGATVTVPVPLNFSIPTTTTMPMPLTFNNVTWVPQIITTPPLPLTVPTPTPPSSAPLPLPLTLGPSSLVELDEAIYVNVKQYERILKRRAARAKLVKEGLVEEQPQRLKYLHESRHKHSLNRFRGPLGRFLAGSKRTENGIKNPQTKEANVDSKVNPNGINKREKQTKNEVKVKKVFAVQKLDIE